MLGRFDGAEAAVGAPRPESVTGTQLGPVAGAGAIEVQVNGEFMDPFYLRGRPKPRAWFRPEQAAAGQKSPGDVRSVSLRCRVVFGKMMFADALRVPSGASSSAVVSGSFVFATDDTWRVPTTWT